MGQSGTTHDFIKEKEWSEAQGDEPFWKAVYQKAFPNMVNMMPCPGNFASQRMGIDRIILLSNGKTISIDEKKRRETRKDILLEYLSNDQTRALGWIEKDLSIDYLAYAFMPAKTCYLFDWPILRLTWMRFKTDWLKLYTIPPARNNGYNTYNVAIPIHVLMGSVSNTRMIQL